MVNWSPNFDQLPISQELNESKSAEKLNTSIILPKLFVNSYTFCKLELTETQFCSLWLKFGIDSSLAMFCREAAVHDRANPKLTLPKKDRQLAIIRPQLTALASTSFISDWLSFYKDVQIVDSLACLCWKSVSQKILSKNHKIIKYKKLLRSLEIESWFFSNCYSFFYYYHSEKKQGNWKTRGLEKHENGCVKILF